MAVFKQTETFTTTATGTLRFAGAAGVPVVKSFALQVKCTGAAATSWDIRLEGSLDGVNFTQLIQHQQTDTDGTTKFQAAGIFTPVLYWRVRCNAISFGSATNIVAMAMAVP